MLSLNHPFFVFLDFVGSAISHTPSEPATKGYVDGNKLQKYQVMTIPVTVSEGKQIFKFDGISDFKYIQIYFDGGYSSGTNYLSMYVGGTTTEIINNLDWREWTSYTIYGFVNGSNVLFNSLDSTWSKQTNNYLPTIGGTMTGNIDMGANAITNVQKIHVDGAAPIYIGSTVESGATNAARLTGVAGGGAAFVKANKQSEYATVSVGTPTQREHAINMGYLVQEVIADQPTQPRQIANKDYVDSCTGKCVQVVDSPNGVLKAYLQNGSRQDVCVVSDAGLSSSIARYTAKGHLIDQSVPTENNHLTNKQYVDNVVKAGNFSGSVQVGGDLTINGTASVLKLPTQDVDIPNKGYVDASLSDVVRKAKVAVSGNSSVNVPLSNGVYLLAVSDNGHGGLVCVSVYPDEVTISGLVNLNGWTCTRTTGENSVTLNNTVASNMDIYITSIGEGAYR